MVERSQYLRLALEARDPVSVFRQGWRQDLDRHLAIDSGIGRAVNDAHTAFAELGGDPVLRDHRARTHSFSPAIQVTTISNSKRGLGDAWSRDVCEHIVLADRTQF